MRTISLVLLLIAGLVISGCVNPTDRGDVPANAVTITITYSPEKDEWLKDRIAAFNRAREQV
ncbi:MAG: hypothetical protein J7466_18845, partial [Roseiflexus sp.]|nr:hypothetical protein [Roseiflexus sp.]